MYQVVSIARFLLISYIIIYNINIDNIFRSYTKNCNCSSSTTVQIGGVKLYGFSVRCHYTTATKEGAGGEGALNTWQYFFAVHLILTLCFVLTLLSSPRHSTPCVVFVSCHIFLNIIIQLRYCFRRSVLHLPLNLAQAYYIMQMTLHYTNSSDSINPFLMSIITS